MQQDPLFKISGRIILITGAAGGIGSVISKALAERGVRLIITDIRKEAVEILASKCADPSQVEAMALDIRDEKDIEEKIQRIVSQYGRLDGLINAAGILRTAPLSQLSSEDFKNSIECNLTGPFLLTRAAAKAMDGKKGGRILHLASVSSAVANPEYAAYASSKAGLSHLVRVAARELAAQGITVNAIGQAVTETPLSAKLLSNSELRANVIEQIPMGRLCTPEDILATVILLMAPGGSFITGQTLYVDGGRTLV